MKDVCVVYRKSIIMRKLWNNWGSQVDEFNSHGFFYIFSVDIRRYFEFILKRKKKPKDLKHLINVNNLCFIDQHYMHASNATSNMNDENTLLSDKFS